MGAEFSWELPCTAARDEVTVLTWGGQRGRRAARFPVAHPGRKIMAAKQKTKSPPQKPGTTAPSRKSASARPAAASDPVQATPPATAGSPAKLSALEAAARVLRERGQALSCPELIAAMAAQGYWTSPAGKTPQATLHAALTREIQTKQEQSRFRKTRRGQVGPARTRPPARSC